MNDLKTAHPESETAATGVKLANGIPGVPPAVGPYSQLAIAGDTVYLSGQIPLNPETGKLAGSSIEEQTEQVFNNIEAALKGAGLNLNDVARSSVYLTDMGDFAKMNAIYARRFGSHKPARETIGVVALAMGAAIEITIIATTPHTRHRQNE